MGGLLDGTATFEELRERAIALRRADLVGVEAAELQGATLKKHNPQAVRKNAGGSYGGCLVVAVSQSADLYRRVEGWWYGIVLGSKRAGGNRIA